VWNGQVARRTDCPGLQRRGNRSVEEMLRPRKFVRGGRSPPWLGGGLRGARGLLMQSATSTRASSRRTSGNSDQRDISGASTWWEDSIDRAGSTRNNDTWFVYHTSPNPGCGISSDSASRTRRNPLARGARFRDIVVREAEQLHSSNTVEESFRSGVLQRPSHRS